MKPNTNAEAPALSRHPEAWPVDEPSKPVKTPRTTTPRPTDAASRAKWKRERAIALGDLPAPPKSQ
jgi:hypothetical protein